MSGSTEFDPAPGGVEHTTTSYTTSTGGDDRSLGQIVGDIATDLSTLVKQELALAKTELKEEAGKAGKGAGMLGAAGVAGLMALILGSFALAWLIDHFIPRSAAFAIVMLLWALIAAVLAAKGKKELKKANPQLPETQQTLKEDAAWVKAQKN